MRYKEHTHGNEVLAHKVDALRKGRKDIKEIDRMIKEIVGELDKCRAKEGDLDTREPPHGMNW